MDACQHLKFQLLQIPFFLRICHTELHDHVSALAEQRVNMCCAFTHQLCSRRWAQWTGKVGLPLAINLKYPYKTSHLRCRIAVHVFSVAFNPGFPGTEQPKKIYWQGWRDVKEFQTEKKGTTIDINHLLCHGKASLHILPDAACTYENSSNAETQT